MSTGHSHPRVTRTAAEQASALMQIGNRFTNPARIRLAERLAALAPDAESPELAAAVAVACLARGLIVGPGAGGC